VATIFVRLIVSRGKYPITAEEEPTSPHRLTGSMSSTLLLLGLLAVVLGLGSFLRSGSRKSRPIFQGNDIFAGRLTEGLLHALVSDRGFLRADTRVAGFEGSAAVVERDGACGRLVLCPALAFGRESDLPVLVHLAARFGSDRRTTLVVVGGSEAFGRAALEATAPARTLHIDDTGRVREARAWFRPAAPRLVVENALDRMAAELGHGAFPALDFETARGLVSSGGDEEGRTPPPVRGVVTSALTAAILVCFAAEVAMSPDAFNGGGAALAVAYRMGGIYQKAILAGEWQRLIGAPFLHFGLLHLAMNGWAQWSLGAPIEFLVGPWRFLGLWVASALGASLTSLVFNDTSVAAGASGAIFGLLGAFTTFVFFRKDVLPQPVPRPLRKGVLVTLVLNLLISFLPSIDMAAHAGGFLTGAVIALGLARRPRGEATPARPWPLRLTVAALVVVGVGITSIQERPDLALSAPGIGSEHALSELRLPIPKGFAVTESRARGLTTIEADGAPASPYSVTYKVSEPQTDETAALRVLQSLRPEASSVKDSGWIAVSQAGVQDLRAIEIVVVAPNSGRAEAERLIAALAAAVR
jgi:membrane associated rhomboid family serine protease